MKRLRQNIIATVTFLGGLYFFLEFVLPKNIAGFKFGAYHEQISLGVATVGVMAIGLGLINVLQVHGLRLIRAQKGWSNSAALLTGLFLMFVVQTVDFVTTEKSVTLWRKITDSAEYVERLSMGPENKIGDGVEKVLISLDRTKNILLTSKSSSSPRIETLSEEYLGKLAAARTELEFFKNNLSNQSVRAEQVKKVTESLRQTAMAARLLVQEINSQTVARKLNSVLFDGFFNALGASMFALLAFYIANAAYRSFRIRSVEASVLMLAAVLVILGQIPHGSMYISENLPDIRLWILNYINTPGNRAIYFGAAMAGLAMAVRMWLSLEKSPLSENKE